VVLPPATIWIPSGEREKMRGRSLRRLRNGRGSREAAGGRGSSAAEDEPAEDKADTGGDGDGFEGFRNDSLTGFGELGILGDAQFFGLRAELFSHGLVFFLCGFFGVRGKFPGGPNQDVAGADGLGLEFVTHGFDVIDDAIDAGIGRDGVFARGGVAHGGWELRFGQ